MNVTATPKFSFLTKLAKNSLKLHKPIHFLFPVTKSVTSYTFDNLDKFNKLAASFDKFLPNKSENSENTEKEASASTESNSTAAQNCQYEISIKLGHNSFNTPYFGFDIHAITLTGSSNCSYNLTVSEAEFNQLIEEANIDLYQFFHKKLSEIFENAILIKNHIETGGADSADPAFSNLVKKVLEFAIESQESVLHDFEHDDELHQFCHILEVGLQKIQEHVELVRNEVPAEEILTSFSNQMIVELTENASIEYVGEISPFQFDEC